MFTFNLVDEKWIPCTMPGGRYEEMGLRDVLLKANSIEEIFDPSPLVAVAVHRLLLAILHHSHNGPETEADWQNLWRDGRGTWDDDKLLRYLTEKHDRFDLFDAKHPFYQCAVMPIGGTDTKGQPKSYSKSIANLIHELATGDNATLFDHTTESNAQAVSPAEAARLLIAFQAFAVGGLLTYEIGQAPKFFKSANNAPLVKGAVILVRGKNLFQTLMLNLHKYNRDDEEPFTLDPNDLPAWERDEETLATDRHPKGYLDLLTWQSRRVRLLPEQDEQGQIIVGQVVIMKGNRFPEGFLLRHKETMLAFTKLKKPSKGQDPWPPVAFREERALWRDSLALFQSAEEERTRPKMLDWLNDICAKGIIPESTTYDLSVTGLVTSKAKISLWRHERLPLPLKYLENDELLTKLRAALNLAEEDVGESLNASAWNLARLIIAPEAERLNDNQKKDVNRMADHMAITRPYWARLGLVFHKLLTDLAEDVTQEVGEVIHGENSLPWWASEVRKAAWFAFHEATDSLDRSGRMLKALAKAEANFGSKLNIILRPYKLNVEKGGESND